MIRVTTEQYNAMAGKKPQKKDIRPFYANKIPKRVDANQPGIVKTLRKLGFAVLSLHEVGNGCYDLMAAKHGLNVLCEVKNGIKPPSARELTPAQRKFNFSWQGMRCVLTCEKDCIRLSEQITAISYRLKECGIVMYVYGSREPMYQPSLFA